MNVGIMGCGNISQIYLDNLTSGQWPEVDLIAVADLDPSRAEAHAAEHPAIKALMPEELLADPAIELVINLTLPQTHASIAQQALQAGKHHYSEKPMALSATEAQAILATARRVGKVAGCAPDTFLGAGVQTAVQAVRDGKIGQPVAAMAYMLCPGHESWHPAPEFYYQPGGGPLWDMGPYYLTALIEMLGPVEKVLAVNQVTFPTRTITSEPRKGQMIPVEVPTHSTAILQFANGATGSIVMSFDCVAPVLPPLALAGTAGALNIPDPNVFDGDVLLSVHGEEEPSILQPVNANTENCRGLGVVEMVRAIQADREPYASGERAAHVVWVIEQILAFS